MSSVIICLSVRDVDLALKFERSESLRFIVTWFFSKRLNYFMLIFVKGSLSCIYYITTSCLVIIAYWVFCFFYWKPFEFSSQGFSYIEENKAGPIYVLVSGIFWHLSQPYCPGLSLSISHLSGCYFYLIISLSVFVVKFSGFYLTIVTSWP